MESFGKNIYNQTIEIGRFSSNIKFYIAIFVAIILIMIGIYLILKKQDNLVDITAKILNANCIRSVKNKKYIYNCVLTVEYIINNKKYSGVINTSSDVPYVKDQIIDITYDKENPNKITIKQLRLKWIGLILLIISLLIMVSSFYMKYVTQKFELMAAATGTSNVISTFKNNLK